MMTTVWWDINGCPVPDDYDVGKVGPCIKLALAKLGIINGPITINALGDLKEIPDQVLKSLTASGISVTYLPFNVVLYTAWICSLHKDNIPPGNTQVFIMDYHNLPSLSRVAFFLKERGYNIVLVCPEEPPEKFPEYADLDVLCLPWESVLQDAKISETCSVNCRICHLGFSSLADFTVHLNSEKHAKLVDAIFYERPKPNYEDSSEEDEDLDEQDDPKKQKT